MPDFLLEIGCEEIPARMIDAASTELCGRVSAMLSRERLSPGEIISFSTPRRLTMIASGISAAQPDITEQVNGPSVSAAYKDGQPTPAAHGFAKKAGIDVSQLEIVNTPKGECVSAKVTKRGGTAAEILAQNLPKEISSIYWPKNMYWRKAGERFVRPVRWLVAMLDEETISLEFDGMFAGKLFARAQAPVASGSDDSARWIGLCRSLAHGQSVWDVPSASIKFAKLWTLPRERFPERGGGKTSLCSKPSST